MCGKWLRRRVRRILVRWGNWLRGGFQGRWLRLLRILWMCCDGDFRSLSLITPGGGFWDGILYASEWLCSRPRLSFVFVGWGCFTVFCVLRCVCGWLLIGRLRR